MSYKATAWAYDMRISGPQKPVLVALADMADESASCYPGQQRIADMTGLSVATVRRALDKLEAQGLIIRERRADGFGHRTSDRYRLQLTVSVPESLPLTVPSRQRAYKALSQSLPLRESIPTAHSAQGTISEPLENHQGGAPLKPTCGKHPNGTDKPCKKCGDARRAYDAARAIEKAKPTPIPPRTADIADHVHKWVADGTCMFPGCVEREAA